MVSTTLKSWSDATTVRQLSSHTYAAHFEDSWCIGTVPNGGYITGIFLQVAETHFNTTLSSQNQPHTITLHLDFLRRTQEGPAKFTVKDVKLGRQTSLIHVTLNQGERDEVVGYITNSNMYTETGVSFPTHWKLDPAPADVDLALLKEDKDMNWGLQKNILHANTRKATQNTLYYYPRNGQKAKNWADEWIRPSNGDRWTNTSLGYVSDNWPLPVDAYLEDSDPDPNTLKNIGDSKSKAQSRRYWYPTVLLNLDFKKPLPEEGVEWLFARVHTKQIKNGRMDIEVTILDEGGDIVALSHHVALAVGVERNSAARKTGSKI